MTQTIDSCHGGRPSGARRLGAGRTATRRTRTRVSADAVVSAYIHEIARPHADGVPHEPYRITSPPPSLNRRRLSVAIP